MSMLSISAFGFAFDFRQETFGGGTKRLFGHGVWGPFRAAGALSFNTR